MNIYTIEEYIDRRRKISKQLGIWGHLTIDEKEQFMNCQTEIQVDNLMTMFRRKYL